MEKLDKFVGGLKGKHIAYIPTAANGEEPYGTWKNGTTWNEFSACGAIVQVFELENYKEMHFPDSLRNFDILFVAGGMPGYLMYWMRRTYLDVHLKKMLDDGLIYVGSSAGSMVTAPTLHSAEVYLDEVEPGVGIFPGLGLVDFDFYPHYKEGTLDQIKKNYKGSKMYLVKNGEAITVENSKVTILGDERLIS